MDDSSGCLRRMVGGVHYDIDNSLNYHRLRQTLGLLRNYLQAISCLKKEQIIKSVIKYLKSTKIRTL